MMWSYILEAFDIDQNRVTPTNLAAKYSFIDSGSGDKYFEKKIAFSKSSQKTVFLKVALSQKILENFYVSNIPSHYPEQKIWISYLLS